MFFVDAIIVGSLAYAAARWAYSQRPRPMMYWLAIPNDVPFDAATAQPIDRDTLIARSDRALRIANISMGVAFVGLIYYPVNAVSLALTLISASQMVVRSIDAAIRDNRWTRDTLGTVSLYGLLLLDGYFSASVLQWIFAFNERLAIEVNERLEAMHNSQDSASFNEFMDFMRRQWLYIQMWSNGDVIQLAPDQIHATDDKTRPSDEDKN